MQPVELKGKAKIKADVEAILEKYPTAPKALKAELVELFKSQRSGTQNPPVLNEDGTIKEAWCRFHERYEPVADMVVNPEQTKSKGLCKAASRTWHQNNSIIKTLEKEASAALISGDVDTAMAKAKEAKERKEQLNEAKYYNFEADWKTFNDAQAEVQPATEAK